MKDYFDLQEELYLKSKDVINYKYVQIPYSLISNKIFADISSDAKILYGLLVNRLGLSIRNDMYDDKGRYYIYYTIDSVMEDLGIGRTKAKLLFRELTDIRQTGIGLVKKIRVPNKPSRIYIMNFTKVVSLIESRMDVYAADGGT